MGNLHAIKPLIRTPANLKVGLPMGFPIYVTHVNVGRGRGTVLVSIESPAGDIANGQVQNIETARVVMSESTFAEVTALFVDTLKKMRPANLPAAYPTNGSSPHADQGSHFEGFTDLRAASQKH
jgi:hypothetical protein